MNKWRLHEDLDVWQERHRRLWKVPSQRHLFSSLPSATSKVPGIEETSSKYLLKWTDEKLRLAWVSTLSYLKNWHKSWNQLRHASLFLSTSALASWSSRNQNLPSSGSDSSETLFLCVKIFLVFTGLCDFHCIPSSNPSQCLQNTIHANSQW